MMIPKVEVARGAASCPKSWGLWIGWVNLFAFCNWICGSK